VKILAFVHAYVPDHMAGAETTLHAILKALAERGWNVDVLLSEREPHSSTVPYVIDGVNVIPFDPSDIQRFNRDIVDADIVMTHLASSERAAFVCRYNKKPCVHVVHNTLWQTEGYLAEGCDLAVYNSIWVADFHDNGDKGPVVMISAKNGEEAVVSIRTRRCTEWSSVVVHPIIIPSDYAAEGPHDCITLINLAQNKGPDILYQLAARFPRKKFLGVKGGYGEQLISELPNVEILENTADIRKVYARTRVLLMPSTYESFGRVAIEAAASGIPTVASPTPGLREALGPTGIFVEGDISEWVDVVASLDNPKRYEVAKRNALKRSQYWAESIDSDLAALDSALHKLLK